MSGDVIMGRSGMGSTNRSDGWMEWYRENGVWRSRFHASGEPPKGAKKRGEGWVVPDAPSSAEKSSTSTSTSNSTTARDPDQPPPRNGRAPYYKPERYFDATAGRWRWRWRYVPTNAEVQARRDGLKHDAQGYYRTSGGKRTYVTGRTATGRRFHWDASSGQRKRVWDDPYKWPSAFSERRKRLTSRRDELKDRAESLREQYRKARSDQHLLRRNILRRLRQTEAELARVNASLKRIPRANPFLLDFSKVKPKLRAGIRVSLDFAKDPDDEKQDLSFSPTIRVGRNNKVWVRATISIEDRDWRPGMLGAPEVMHVRWTVPKGWLPLGRWHAGSDEWIVSNPLYIVRPFRSPGKGDRTPRFGVRAQCYEFSFSNPGGRVIGFEGL